MPKATLMASAFLVAGIACGEVPTWSAANSLRISSGRAVHAIAFEPEVAAEFVRREAGFGAVQAGLDEVTLDPKAPAAWQEQFEFAAHDRAAALKLMRIADVARRSGEEDVRLMGRRARQYVMSVLSPLADDPDECRARVCTLLRELEGALGLPLSPLAVRERSRETYVPRLSPDGSAGQVVEVEYGIGNRFVEVNRRLAVSVNFAGLSVRVSGDKGEPMTPTTKTWTDNKTEFPDDGIYRFKLVIPLYATDSVIAYRYEVDMANGAMRELPLQPYSDRAPKLLQLKRVHHFAATADGKWSAYMLELEFKGLYPFALPGYRDGKQDVWRLEVTYPDGRVELLRLVYPPGSKEFVARADKYLGRSK